MSERQIPGMIMRPCSTTEEDNEKIFQSNEFFCKENFFENYRKYLIALSITAESAKIYLAKNWERVTDWSDLEVKITDNTGETTEYFNYKPSATQGWNTKIDAIKRMVEDMDRIDREKHNPITSLNGVVLDPTDGDFSLTINGKDHLWIDDESVIIIADYVEKQLNGKLQES